MLRRQATHSRCHPSLLPQSEAPPHCRVSLLVAIPLTSQLSLLHRPFAACQSPRYRIPGKVTIHLLSPPSLPTATLSLSLRGPPAEHQPLPHPLLARVPIRLIFP